MKLQNNHNHGDGHDCFLLIMIQGNKINQYSQPNNK